jgi:drug/metabolite transporter (DMT)-like permease
VGTGPSRVVVPTRAGTIAAATAVLLWGSGNVLVKYIHLAGPALAFNRLWMGSVVFTAAFLLRGGRLSRRAMVIAAPGGIAFGLDVVLFFTSVKHTTVADASIIGALQPAVIFLVAGRMFGERVTGRTIWWSAAAGIGVVLAVLGSAKGAGRTPYGDFLATLALAAWVWYFIASKRAREQLGALEYQAALTIVAAIVVTPVALTAGSVSARTPTTAALVLLLVAVPGGGHLLMNWAHEHCSISLASLVTLGIPVVGTIGAAIFLSEQVTAIQVAGMALVLIALAMVVSRSAPVEVLGPVAGDA